MKKFFAFVAAALVAFSFTACNGNSPEANGFKIEISNIQAKSAHIAVTPADTLATYYWDLVPAATAAKWNDDSVVAYVKDYFDYAIEYYKYYSGVTYTYADLLLNGFDEYDYTKLEPNTEYTVFAVKLDENLAVKGGVAKKNFKTLEVKEDPVPTDMTFQITAEDITFSGAAVTVTPSNNEATYYWNILGTAEIAGMSDADLCAEMKSNIEYYIQMYEYYYGKEYTIADFLSKGPDAYTFDDLDANTDYTVIAFAMGTEGTYAGAVAKYAFKTSELVAQSVQEIVLENAICDDACDIEGWWQLMAAPADSSIYFSISPMEAEQLAGTWTMDDMDADYTYVYVPADQAAYDFVSCNLVTTVENNLFVLTGTALATNAVEYHFNISATIKVLTDEDFSAPARKAVKKAAAKKEFKAAKKGNLQKSGKFVSEKLLNR